MKRIVLVSGNYLLIERISALISMNSEMDYHLLSTTKHQNVVEDAELFDADTIIVDATSCSLSCAVDLVQDVIKKRSASECKGLLLIRAEDKKLVADILKEMTSQIEYAEYDESLTDLFCALARR